MAYGAAITMIVENHHFFKSDCKISNNRFKHQEYLDNAMSASFYNCTYDIKAPDLRNFYSEFADKTIHEMQPLLKKTSNVLTSMLKLNSFHNGIFRNKWTFVDVFYFLYKYDDKIGELKAKTFAENFYLFDQKRLEYNSKPEPLIKNRRNEVYDPNLYSYIIAFKTGGAEKKNLIVRHESVVNKFFNKSNIIFK